MDEDQLKQAIESQYGGTATLAQTVPVREYFVGRPAWEGIVYVFDLERHPVANRAYAWLSPGEDSAQRRLFAVLQLDGIKTPKDAVRAAIAAEHKARRDGKRFLGN